MSNAVSNLNSILNRIAEAEKKAERTPGSTRLIIVSKTFDSDDIRPLLEHGWRRFGENRVQEAQSKWPKLRDEFPDIELHLIGPLQSNKTAEAVALFDVMHTVDRKKIANTLASEFNKQNRQLSLRIQVNTGSEPQKAGVEPEQTIDFVEDCEKAHGLMVSGLMCIPPASENPGPHFALLRKLRDEAGENVKELSMGMSGDFETAIAFGATEVRVGSAIFGNRDYPA